MAAPLLKTKLYIPHARPGLMPRPRLLERLDEGTQSEGFAKQSLRFVRKLTLISAPAGFGKTTLLANWINQTNHRVAWLSLDAEDNDAVRFWSYLIAALQTVRADIGQAGLAALQSPQPPSIESVLTRLMNEITDTDMNLVLLLDDFHVITESKINDGFTFLLDHLPPQMHLILATRADPPWPLARLRARGEMIELRTEDLRFTLDEVSTFLNEVMGLALSPRDIARLDTRTEGWIAGLQLAALSMQGRGDAAGFVQAFSGSHRFVLDYLVEEVLDRQPEHIREFLLKTSILERLTASLCDTVIGETGLDSQSVLTHLERANLFLISLDDDRQWYRYHHLFADLLSSRLAQFYPDQVSVFHRRAAKWYEEREMIAQAIGHALQAGDIDQTERLVKQNALAMVFHGESRTLITALEKLPDRVIRSRPWLCIGYAWALAYADRYSVVRDLLCAVESLLKQRPSMETFEKEHITGQIAAIHAHAVALEGGLQQAIDLASTALRHLPESDSGTRAFVTSELAVFIDRAGDHVAATTALEEVIATSLASGDLPTAIFALSRLAGIQSVQGKLGKLIETYQEAMRLTNEYGHRSPAVAQACMLAGGAMYYRNDLVAAERYIRESMELCAEAGQLEGVAAGYITLSRVLLAMDDQEGASDTMEVARRLGDRISPWYASFGAAWEALLHLRQGNLDAAVDWAQESGLHFDDEVSQHTYVKHIVLARVLVAQGGEELRKAGSAQRLEEALQLLDRLVALSESKKANRYLIESLVVRALAFQAQCRVDEALADLGYALTVAEPEGYVRTFIEEGAPMEALLKNALTQGIATDYVRHLLDESAKESLSTAASTQQKHPTLLIEPLSERELDVLRLLPTNLSSTEIAEELYISRNTVRSHIGHIYDKLGVHNREDAVQRAQELGLI